MGYFQKPGAAEAEFEEDPQRFYRLFLYGFSGDAPEGTVDKLFANKPAGAQLLEGFPEPSVLPGWLTQADINYYAGEYKKTGLTGTLNFYRNINEDYPLLKKAIRKYLGSRVRLVDSAEETAKEVESQLKKKSMARQQGRGAHGFFVTDAPDRFVEVGRRFLGEKVESAVRIER